MEPENDSPIQHDKQKNSPMVAIVVSVIGLILLAVVGFFLINGNKNDSGSSSSASSNQDTSTVYTKAQVAEHSSKTDCWTIIDGKVYNLTQYIPRHEGGDNILLACGKDGTSLFETRTTDSGQKIEGGGSHSNTARSQLAKLQIGSLAQ